MFFSRHSRHFQNTFGKFGALALAAVALGACDKSDKPASGSGATASATATVSSAAASASAIPVDTASAPPNPSSMMSLGERFASEAKNRPTGTVTVEQVHGAMKAKGLVFKFEKQHLGAPFYAAYCMGSELGDDVALSVCEYTSAPGAEKGKAASEKAFASVPNRKLYLNGATMLTVREGKLSPDNDKIVAAVVETFQKLKAAPAPAGSASAAPAASK